METVYLLSFMTGLLGGFGHCIGMCGPLVASYSFASKDKKGMGMLPAHLLYNAGRITTYTFVGSLMGLTGTFVNTAVRISGIQNGVSIIAGLFMVLLGLGITGISPVTTFIERHNRPILSAVKVVFEGDSIWRYYPLGLLLGFLPCGLSYSIFLGAAGSGGLLQGMFFVLAFSLGTVPALLTFGVVVTYLSSKVRGFLYRMGGVTIILAGLMFIARGIRSYAQM